MTENKTWDKKYSEKLLREIGIRQGHVVLDFGCRTGNYTIPIARIIGNEGCVFALDTDRESLDKLMQKAVINHLANIKRIAAREKIKIPLKDETVDVVLLYDVIHLVQDRERLYSEVHRISKSNALISVLPKHFKEYMNMNLTEIRQEMERFFKFETIFFKTINHDDKLQRGHIFNFRKVKMED